MSPPPFQRIAIYGLGLIGGSIGLAIRHRWPDVRVVAIDRQHVLDAALQMQMADAGGTELDTAAGADLLILAAPVLQNVAALEALPRHVSHSLIVTDVGSTKRAAAAAAAALPSHIAFVGGHPLSGAAVSGLEAARPDLFLDRPWILTGTVEASPDVVAALEALIVGLGAVPQRMDAAAHDLLLAYVSHLPQLAVSALMHVVGAQANLDGLALAGRGLRDTTRLASSPAGTWRDIVATNGDNVSRALGDLIAALEELRSAAEGRPARMEEIFLSAAKWKGVLDHS